MITGYCRISTKSQEENTSLENQEKILKEAGAEKIYKEIFTGATMDRPVFNKMEKELKAGDTLIVCKLDRFSRSTEQGIKKIKELANRGIKINILNMGVVDLSNPMGEMMLTILLAFATYEKACIVERMREGKQVAKQKEGFREGRPPKDRAAIEKAIEMKKGGATVKEITAATGVGKATLYRYLKEAN